MNNPTIQICTFRCSNRLLGVPLVDIKEVAIETSSTPVPHTPPEVRGLVNIRGQIVLALDLSSMLGLVCEIPATEQHLIILKPSVGPAFGIVVEEVGEIASCHESQMERLESFDPALVISEDRSHLVQCTCNLSQGLLILLDPRKFLPFVEHLLLSDTYAGRSHANKTS